MSGIPIYCYYDVPLPDKCDHPDTTTGAITVETSYGTYRTAQEVTYCRTCGSLTDDVTTRIEPKYADPAQPPVAIWGDHDDQEDASE